MLKAGNQKKQPKPRQVVYKDVSGQELTAEQVQELQRRRLQKSNGQPMSGLVDTETTEYED
jgi:hypothetical protein